MAHDHLYQPAPCSSWPVEPLRAVGSSYRAARGEGQQGEASVAQAMVAYIAAGGSEAAARETVLAMLASLSVEHGDWLWGPAQEWLERHPSAAEDADLLSDAP